MMLPNMGLSALLILGLALSIDARPRVEKNQLRYPEASGPVYKYHVFGNNNMTSSRRNDSTGLFASFDYVYDFLETPVARVRDPSDEYIAELDEMFSLLRETNHDVDELSYSLGVVMRSLEPNHDLTRIMAKLSDYLYHLQYCMHLTEDELNFDDTNQVIINRYSMEWATAALSQTDNGLGPVLFGIHEIVTGSFASEPIRNIFMDALLLASHSDVWGELEKLAETIVEMQKSGYSHWGIALDISARYSEKSQVESLMDERLSLQLQYLVLDQRYLVWPQSRYGLVQAASGCPTGEWHTGSRYHDTDDKKPYNQWSPSNFGDYVRSAYGSNNMDWAFCMKSDISDIDIQWPSGEYCVFKYGDICPAGFMRGSLLFDDENTRNDNRKDGEVPSGKYDHDTLYEFCCRDDGDVDTEIYLPLEKPFVLFPRHDSPCQTVNKMLMTELYFFWDCEDKNPRNSREPPYPRETDQGDNMRVHMCHYTFA